MKHILKLKIALLAVVFFVMGGSLVATENHIDIIEKNCVPCHTVEQLTTNYPFKVNLKDRINRSKDDPKLMPHLGPPLNSKSIKILEMWIDNEFPGKWIGDEFKKNRDPEPLVQVNLSLEQLKLIEDHNQGRSEIVYFIMNRYNDLYEDALRKLLNSLSWNDELIFPQPLDYSRTILYVDSRSLFWNWKVLNDIREAYPPSRNYPQLIIPIDWFVVSSSDARSLYHNILYDSRDIYYEINLIRNKLSPPEYTFTNKGGVTFEAVSNPIQRSSDPIWTRDGLELFNSAGVYGKDSEVEKKWTSGVSYENRILDRLESIYGVYWKSYDFTADEEYNNIFNYKDNLRHFGNEMIFSLPNGLHAYLITNRKGERLKVAPYAIVKHPYDPNIVINPSKPKWIPNPNGDRDILNPENNGNIINGISCMKCHSNGIISFRDETEGKLKTSNEPELTGLIERDNDRYRSQLKLLSVGSNSHSMDSIISIYDRFSKDIDITVPAAPMAFSKSNPQETILLPNYPNPSNPETWIPYQLRKDAEVTISIYNITGHLVRTLSLGYQTADEYHSKSSAAYWDGRNEIGERVASGMYFYNLTAGDFSATRKMMIRK